jgi:hypothetical protein
MWTTGSHIIAYLQAQAKEIASMHITHTDLKNLDDRLPSAPDRTWLRLFKAELERYVPTCCGAFKASECAETDVSRYNTSTIKTFDGAMLVTSAAAIEPEREVR